MILHCREAELDKILALLAKETSCADAAEQAAQIVPQTDLDAVLGLLRETDDAFVLLAKFGAPGFSGLVPPPKRNRKRAGVDSAVFPRSRGGAAPARRRAGFFA